MVGLWAVAAYRSLRVFTVSWWLDVNRSISRELDTLARIVRPTAPRVSSVSNGRATISPASISRATTPSEMTQMASDWRIIARPMLSDTGAGAAGGAPGPGAGGGRAAGGRGTGPGGGSGT